MKRYVLRDDKKVYDSKTDSIIFNTMTKDEAKKLVELLNDYEKELEKYRVW